MGGAPVLTDVAACPFLVPVTADRLWLEPRSAFCRRPGARPRVPGATTVACICMTPAYLVCPGYLAGMQVEPRRVPGRRAAP
jgi:hypothetical protein